MGNLYTSSINYSLDPIPLHTTPMPYGKYISSSVLYDDITEQEQVGPNSEVDLQYFNEQSLLRTYDYVSNILFNMTRLQGPNVQATAANTKQFYVYVMLLSSIRLQYINHDEIINYTRQFPIYNIVTSLIKLQTLSLVKQKHPSRQVKIIYNTIGKVQKIKFSNKEKDNILWMMRSKRKDTKQYVYYSSTDNTYSPLGKNELPHSKEILNRHFIKGTKVASIHGKLFKTINNYAPPMTTDSDFFVNGTYTENPDLLPLQIDLGTDIIDVNWPYNSTQEESVMAEMPAKQVYMQKNNCVDTREIVAYWDKRGLRTNNRYVYWQDTEITNGSTTYNTIQNSNEVLDLNHKKQG